MAVRDGSAGVSGPARRCRWCDGPIPSSRRRDALACSVGCRQAAWRFGAGYALRPPAATALRFAYADPPYPGNSRRLYGGHPDFAGEVDHQALLEQLHREFPDGWALSTSAEALPALLASCSADVRVAAWFRGERPHRRAYRPLSAWEPVIYRGGRARPSAGADRRVDALVHVSRPRTTDRRRVVGAKPGAFCRWLFELLGAQQGDELVDLFPGSGGVARAWADASRARRVGEVLADASG